MSSFFVVVQGLHLCFCENSVPRLSPLTPCWNHGRAEARWEACADRPAALTALRSICSGSESPQPVLRTSRKLTWWKESRDRCCWMRFCGFAWVGTLSQHKAKMKNKPQSLHHGRCLICFLNVKLSQTRPLGHIAKMAITSPHLSRHTLSWEVEVPPIKRWSLFHRTWSLNVEIGLDLDEETGEFTADKRLALEALLSFTGVGTLRSPCWGASAGLLKDERVRGENSRYPGIRAPANSQLPIARHRERPSQASQPPVPPGVITGHISPAKNSKDSLEQNHLFRSQN